LPHWNWQPGEKIDVWCHSNLDSVELFLNGRGLGRRTVARHGHAQWRVRYEPGVLEARGYLEGKLIRKTQRETAGAAAGIVLAPDRGSLRADGMDLSVIEVRVVDQQGRTVPTADHEVSFSLGGPAALIGVGNGNPVSLEPDKADRRRAFNGLCMALVQSQRRSGEISVEATCPGLTPARIRLLAG
jgi:beta-galactosidase